MMPIQKFGMLMPKEADHRADIVEPGIRLGAGPNAQRHADQDGKQRREESKLQGCRQAVDDQLENRVAIFEGRSEIAGQRRGEKLEILYVERLIKAEIDPDPRNIGWRRLVGNHHRRRIARHGMQKQEDQQRNQEDDRDRAGYPFCNEPEGSPAVAGKALPSMG